MLALTLSKDDITKRKASRVLSRLAIVKDNQTIIVRDEQALRCTNVLLTECADLRVRRDMIDMITVLASCDDHNKAIVDAGILEPLVSHLNPRRSSLETIYRVCKCLASISASPAVHENIVDEGLIEAVDVILFHELAEMRQYRTYQRKKEDVLEARKRRLSISPDINAAIAEADPTPKKYLTKEEEMEVHTERACLRLLLNLSANYDCRQALVDRAAVRSILEELVSDITHDRRCLRLMYKIVAQCADTEGKASFRHKTILSQSALPALKRGFRSGDYEIIRSCLEMLAHLALSPDDRLSISESGLVKQACAMAALSVHNVDPESIHWAASLISQLCEDESCVLSLVEDGVIEVLTTMLGSQVKRKDTKLCVLRALSQLSVSKDPETKLRLVTSGALGYLIGIAKRQTGVAKMYAVSAMTNMEHDSAALRIQVIFRGYLVRNERRRKTELDMLSAMGPSRNRGSAKKNNHRGKRITRVSKQA